MCTGETQGRERTYELLERIKQLQQFLCKQTLQIQRNQRHSNKMHTTVFVYGTLKRGFPNHNWLAAATLIGPAWTEASEFRMGNVGAYPEVTRIGHHSPNAANVGFVEGEIYECNLRTIERLDILEDNGRDYQRELIQVRNTPPGSRNSFQQFTAWIYLWQLEPAPLVEPVILVNQSTQETQTIFCWNLSNHESSEILK